MDGTELERKGVGVLPQTRGANHERMGIVAPRCGGIAEAGSCREFRLSRLPAQELDTRRFLDGIVKAKHVRDFHQNPWLLGIDAVFGEYKAISNINTGMEDLIF